jgi:hypothetical protein
MRYYEIIYYKIEIAACKMKDESNVPTQITGMLLILILIISISIK